MDRDELERLSKADLIEMVPRLQQPGKTSRTSSKPPSTDRKERRERSKPGGAKPGHEGHSRPLSDDVSETVAHRPEACPCCRMALSRDLPAEEVGVHERVELPEVRPVVVRHRRVAVRCPGCGTRVVAPPPAAGTPFGHRLRRSHGDGVDGPQRHRRARVRAVGTHSEGAVRDERYHDRPRHRQSRVSGPRGR